MIKKLAALIVASLLMAPTANAGPRLPDTSRLQPATVDLLHYVAEKYPEVPEIGGWRPDRIPDHPSGRALDIMVYANGGLGDRIAADLRANKAKLGIRYLLWRVPQHYDHIHVCVH